MNRAAIQDERKPQLQPTPKAKYTKKCATELKQLYRLQLTLEVGLHFQKKKKNVVSHGPRFAKILVASFADLGT